MITYNEHKMQIHKHKKIRCRRRKRKMKRKRRREPIFHCKGKEIGYKEVEIIMNTNMKQENYDKNMDCSAERTIRTIIIQIK